MADVKVGCCGFATAQSKYYSTFRVIEIQQTFYHPPTLATAARWRQEAPPDFEFALKAWQLITHDPSSPTYRRLRLKIPMDRHDRYGSFRPTDEVMGAWEQTRAIADALNARMIVFQCPASFRPTPENIGNMRSFFRGIDKRDFTLVWEPRGNWDAMTITNLCRELEVVHCVDPFKDKALCGEIKYFRLHGRQGYRYKYSKRDLEELLNACAGRELCYCMFNNVSMFDDARMFQNLLNRQSDA